MKLLAALTLVACGAIASAQPHYWHHHNASYWRHHHYHWAHNRWVYGATVYVGPAYRHRHHYYHPR